MIYVADITLNQAKLNEGVAFTKTAGAASQTLDMSAISDFQTIILLQNGDAADCRVKFSTNGYGASNADDIDVDIAAGEFAVIQVESMYVKDPSTGKATFQILDQDDTAFSGTVANVLVSATQISRGFAV